MSIVNKLYLKTMKKPKLIKDRQREYCEDMPAAATDICAGNTHSVNVFTICVKPEDSNLKKHISKRKMFRMNSVSIGNGIEIDLNCCLRNPKFHWL